MPGNDLQDPATWDAPPPRTLKHLHAELLLHYDCTDQPAAAQPGAGSLRVPTWAVCSARVACVRVRAVFSLRLCERLRLGAPRRTRTVGDPV